MSMDLELDELTPCIRNAKFIIGPNREYTIQFDQNLEMKYLKNMIQYAAHLKRNNFRIFSSGQEYTQYNDEAFDDLFPGEDLVVFNLDKGEGEALDDMEMTLKSNCPCPQHHDKFCLYYCYQCKVPICTNCFTIGEHKGHPIQDKCYYLLSSQFLVDKMFLNFSKNPYSEYQLSFDFKEYITILNAQFDSLFKMLQQVKFNCSTIIEYFNNKALESCKNLRDSVRDIKVACVRALEQLKENLRINEILVNDEVFVQFDKAFKELRQRESDLYNENLKKFQELNDKTPEIIKNMISKIITEFESQLKSTVKLTTFDEIKRQIDSRFINPIDKNEIIKQATHSPKRQRIPRSSENSFQINAFESNDSIYSNNSKCSYSNNIQTNSIFNNFMNNNNNTTTNFNNFKNNLNQTNFNNLANFANSNNTISNDKVNVVKFSTTTAEFGNNDSRFFNSDINSNNIINSNTNKFFTFGQNNNMNNANNINSNITPTGINNNARNTIISMGQGDNTNNMITTTITSTNNQGNGAIEFGQNDHLNNITSTQAFRTNTQFVTASNYKNYSASKNQDIFKDSLANNSKPSFVTSLCHEIQKNTTNVRESTNSLKTEKGRRTTIAADLYQAEDNDSNINKVARIISTNNIQTFNINLNKDKAYLMAPVLETKSIKLMTSNSKEETTIPLNFNGIIPCREFNKGASHCNFNNQLFVSGGYENVSDQEGTKIFFRVIIGNDNSLIIERLPDMINNHSKHTMIYEDNYVYAIGGNNNNTCERYNIIKKQWEKLPPLNIKRVYPMLWIWNSRLYAFFGIADNTSFVESIEYLDLAKPNLQWNLVDFTNRSNICLKRFGCALKIFDDILYFFTGYCGDKIQKSIFSFNFMTNELKDEEKEVGQTSSGEWFIENKLHDIGSLNVQISERNYFGSYFNIRILSEVIN